VSILIIDGIHGYNTIAAKLLQRYGKIFIARFPSFVAPARAPKFVAFINPQFVPTMRDIFAQDANNGAYGIDALSKAVTLANTIYDLVDKVYFDDKKFSIDDLFDVATIGPGLVGQGQAFAVVANQIDEEITDLSEAEKAQLNAIAGERLKDPSYRKVVSGILDVIDGIAEKLNPVNPVG
jgi:hypothetical protein